MNLLYLCHRIPYPPDKGDKIRSYHQIQYLGGRHSVHLACLFDDVDDARHVETLRRHCVSVDAVHRGRTATRLRALAALPTSRSLSVAGFHSRPLARRVARLVQNAKLDAILVFSSSMATYVPRGLEVPLVVDFVDVDSDKWRMYAASHAGPASWVYALEARRLARFESSVARRADVSLFVSDVEADLFRSRGNETEIAVVPMGVDLDYFRPVENSGGEPPPKAIVFVGMMDYFPNIDAVLSFCDRVFPIVRRREPGVRFTIVGRSPSRSVRRLGRRENVDVTGAVPDVRPYLHRAAVAVAPFRVARGVQSKVLEAMAAGVPVVGSRLAFQGLSAIEADGVRIEDEAERQADAIVDWLRDPEGRGRAARAARRFVERSHRWEEHGKRLEAILSGVVERSRKRTRP